MIKGIGLQAHITEVLPDPFPSPTYSTCNPLVKSLRRASASTSAWSWPSRYAGPI